MLYSSVVYTVCNYREIVSMGGSRGWLCLFLLRFFSESVKNIVFFAKFACCLSVTVF